MFEEMASILPDYDRKFNALVERSKLSTWRPSHDRLAKSLSYVYVDIMQFCYDAFCMFLGKKKGFGRHLSVIFDTFWTPFDQRFRSILARFVEHTRLFNRVAREVFTEEVLRHLDKMDYDIQARSSRRESLELEASAQRKQDEEYRERREKELLHEKLHDLRVWIAAPNWATTYESVERCRVESTGNWFLPNQVFQNWLAEKGLVSKSSLGEKALFISAKPGYGKTVLSTQIIDFLRETASKGCLISYFHFDQQDVELQEDRHAVDVASLILNETGHGQKEASLDEIRSILRVYVNHFSPLVIILDGLDECSDSEEFLCDLGEDLDSTECKVILLARHNLYSPLFENMRCHIVLGSQENLQDIELYLHPKITWLLRKKGLSGQQSADLIASNIARRADSMFLWAVLMITYLSAPSLSPGEWLSAIQNLTNFESLETLYTRILIRLQQRTPRSEWPKIQNIFQWLVVQKEPWSVPMLRAALATKHDRATTLKDFIPNLEEVLPYMCGSLIEVKEDNTVRFIHLSVSEFLTTVEQYPNVAQPFLVRLKDGQQSMSRVCLSYLTYNISREPLGGAAWVVPDKELTESARPFLRYAALNWVDHASKCFDCSPDSLDSVNNYDWHTLSSEERSLLQIIYDAILDKLFVTVWIEACWLFGAAPSVADLPCHDVALSSWGTLFDTKISQLSEILEKLEKQWGHILENKPNEIWLPSINTFMGSEFLVGTTAASLQVLGPDTDDKAMIIASQVSSNGTEIGIIKLWPLKFTSMTRINDSLDIIPIGAPEAKSNPRSDTSPPAWRLCYQIWSLENATKISSFELGLPCESLEEYRFIGMAVDYDHFRFPVTISPSLQSVIILGTLYGVSELPEMDTKSPFKIQQLRAAGFPHNLIYERLLERKTIPEYFESPQNDDMFMHIYHGGSHECYTWYQFEISPNEKYIVLIEGGGPPKDQVLRPPMYNSYVLSVFKKIRHGISPVQYERITAIALRCSTSAEKIVCIHPSNLSWL
ncbi:hypothetical protein BDZ45DRAFT_234379 [Acephala macrosclerotiorum]|nr:hypothetical protein BDZ45DRAFT_234379 [Acephala macrosclerotiorum]